MEGLNGTVTAITGASAGIGKAAARELAGRGALVTLAGRSAEKTRRIVDEINNDGGSAGFLQIDLSSPDSVRIRLGSKLLSCPTSDKSCFWRTVSGNLRSSAANLKITPPWS